MDTFTAELRILRRRRRAQMRAGQVLNAVIYLIATIAVATALLSL